MADYTIHEIYNSMAAAASAQDYLQKPDQADWTAWDWLCALNDGLTGDAAGARYETIDRIKEELQALVDVRNEQPAPTEEQMMVRFGSRVRALVRQINYELTFADPSGLTEDEQALAHAAVDEAVLDEEEEIQSAEQQARFERFRRDASDYLVGLIRERKQEEAQMNPSQERLMSLTARMYVADDLRRHLEDRAGQGYPEVFQADEVNRLADSMLASDEAFATGVRTEVNGQEFPDFDLRPAGQAQPQEVLDNIRNYLNDASARIEDLAQTPNQLRHETGGNHLSADLAAVRLGFLKNVRKVLNDTGTGHDWRHWFSRPNNSPEYEAVLTEIQRQIDRLEAGLPIGAADRQRMLQVLDDYTAGKENPSTDFGKARQNNMLRLYAEYADDEEKAAVMQRYNRARGTQDVNDPKHIDLEKEPYLFNHWHMPRSAASEYEQALLRLQTQFNNTLAANRPMEEAEQLELRQNVLRLAALREIITKTRSGEATVVSEEDILAGMSRIENDPRHPVAGAIASAGRDVGVFGELTKLYGDELQNNYRQTENYFRDPSAYTDPLARQLQRLSYPTAAQMYEHAAGQLAALTLPQQGGLSQRQIDDFARLSRRVFALKRIMDRRGPRYHVSSGELMNSIRFVNENSRINAALDRLNMDAVRMNEFRGQLLSPTVSSAVLTDRADRYANGTIREAVPEAQDFFRRIQVPEGDPQLTEEDKAVMRDRLVRVAALNNLENPRVREERFAGRAFISERSFSTDDIEAAMEDVRQNQPAFMNAIEQQLNTAGSVKRLADSLASQRYAVAMDAMRADVDALAALRFDEGEESARLNESIRGRMAELIALHNLQNASGSLSLPVSDETLAAETARVRLSDDYLATERLLQASSYNAEVLYNIFRQPETLSETLNGMVSSVPVVPPGNTTLGGDYQDQLHTLATLANPDTQQGRSMIVTQLMRVIAYRQMTMEAPQGMYADTNMNTLNEKIVAIASDPAYSGFFERIRNDRRKAIDVLSALAHTDDLYHLKVSQMRAQAAGQPFLDPLLPEISRLAELRYQQVFDEGMQELTAAMPAYQAGAALNEEQKNTLLHAAAQMVLGRQAPNGNTEAQISEADRVRRIRELTGGQSDESRLLKQAVDRVSLDGARVTELLGALSAPSGHIRDALRNFALQTPAKWADDAWAKLRAAAQIPHPDGWTKAERDDLMNTYARMVMMRELAKNPDRADQAISLGDADQYAENYLNAGTNRMGLEAVFTDPVRAITTQTLSGRINALATMSAEYQDAGALQQLMALRNLQKVYSADAIVSQNEIVTEMTKVLDDVRFKVLTDPANPKVPAVDFATLNSPYFDNVIEGAVIAAPARRAVVLDGAAETSAEGLRRIFAEELRHDRALNVEAAEARHFAELYAVSLYESDPAWQGKALPSPEIISAQADRITALPDFKAAMRRMNEVPEYKASLESKLKSGAPAWQITNEFNAYAQTRRRMDNIRDERRSDLLFDVRTAMVRESLDRLLETPAVDQWPSDQEVSAASMTLNAKNVGMTQDQSRTMYLDFLASNRLYMRNPERSFFSEEEKAAARAEVEQDQAVMQDLEAVMASPKTLRLNIFNLAPSQYWTEIKAMEDGRGVYLNSGDNAPMKMLGLQTITFNLAGIVASRLDGRDIRGNVISNDDVNIQRNRLLFSEDFICLENALRVNINELDRIKDVLKLPADRFRAAYESLVNEYKEKYPEAEIPDKNTLAGDYLKAKKQVASLEGKDFANDADARKQLADSIREIMTIRNIILTSKYDVSLKKNTIDESDSRHTRGVEAAEEAGRHHITMRLGTPQELEEKLKDPQAAARYMRIMSGAEDLRRLYGRKLQSGREIVDPLEQQILDQNLDAPVLSHEERRLTVINQIMNNVPDETPEARNARLKQQIASLFNLTLHAYGTDPKNMPSDAVLAEQTQKIMAVPDLGFAVDRLAKDPAKLTSFINRASAGMTAAQMADELNRLSYEEQKERNPESSPLTNILFRMRINAMNEANHTLTMSATHASNTFSSNGERDETLRGFMHYTAVNRLMAQHPDRIYFSEAEVQDSFLQAMNDEQLQREYAQTASGGPLQIRQDLFSYGGGALLTGIRSIEDYSKSVVDMGNDTLTYEGFRDAIMRQLGTIAWLHDNHMVEQNHFTTTKQTDDAADAFLKTPEHDVLVAAAKLDNEETGRFMARILPLSGDAFRQELNRVVEEYRAPLDLAGQRDKNRIRIGLYADRLLDPQENRQGNLRSGVKSYLADTLNLALLSSIPAGQQPNTEEFIRQREELMKLPEFQKAAEWLSRHPQEIRQLSRDLAKGLTPEQIVARMNEAAEKQLKAEDPKNDLKMNLVNRLQVQTMFAQRSKYWGKCGATNIWPEGEKELFREEFLDFIAMDDLIRKNPNRVYFGREEIRAARVPFENDRDFMGKTENALKTPWVARKNICKFRADNQWSWTSEAVKQWKFVAPMLKRSNVSEVDKQQLVMGVMGALAKAAVCKLHNEFYSEPDEQLPLEEELSLSVPFRALSRGLMNEPNMMDKLQNEVYSLEGDAFRAKLEEVGKEYVRKYPIAKADSAAMKADIRRGKQRAANRVKQPEKQPQPAVKPAAKPAEPQNRINIINEADERKAGGPKEEEPKNVINVPKLPREIAARLKPVQIAVPEKNLKDTVMGQFQTSVAMLERTLFLQQQGEIPIKNDEFLNAAHQGILRAVACRNLAEKPEYAGKTVGKEALNAEIDRLRKDPALANLRQVIAGGHAGAVLEGLKKLNKEPDKMNRYLKGVCKDPAGTHQYLKNIYPEPAPKYVQLPSLPKTEVKNDDLPKAAEGQVYAPASPMGRYLQEMKGLTTLKKDAKKALVDNYEEQLGERIASVYALRQIMAEGADPAAADEGLNRKIAEKRSVLYGDKAFRSIVGACAEDEGYMKKVQKSLAMPSYRSAEKQMQKAAETATRYDVAKANKRIDADNQKIRQEAEKQSGGLVKG